jgi:dihydrofolate reductase
MSLDGHVTTPDGWPVQLADPNFSPGQSYGFREFQQSCDAALMGRTTFEPALASDRWPWPDMDVFVLGSRRPASAPSEVVFDHDPRRLLDKVRRANRGGDVHLVGGPGTIETFRRLGALDKLGLIVLRFLTEDGMRLTPSVSTEAGLKLESQQVLPGGYLEIVYTCDG